MVKLKIGSRLKSVVCDTEVVVVRSTSDDVDLRCGGHPMMGVEERVPEGATLDPTNAEGSALGKRYVDAGGRFELLCSKAGDGSLSAGGEALRHKDTKPLPASD